MNADHSNPQLLLNDAQEAYKKGDLGKSLEFLEKLRFLIDEAHPLYTKALSLITVVMLTSAEKENLLTQDEIQQLFSRK
jgi:hypothetical protein